MINKIYRLVNAKQITVDFEDRRLEGDGIIVRPTKLSICAADQRYYTGTRGKEAMRQKLPMALIHEAIGEVVFDPKRELVPGTKVVMIPNTPIEKDDVIKENYLRSSYFRSSGFDGFMQSLVTIRRDRVIPYDNISDRVAVLLELMSVGMNALEHFEHYSHLKKQTLGVWGCGSVGFATALILKKTFPNAEVIVFGTTDEKLSYFQFADQTFRIDNIPPDLRVDHAFECVGGSGCEDAINQIIDYINPEGTIALMGVSENNVPINTRMVLEKGLTLIGNSRSSYEDFYNSIEFLRNYPETQSYLENIISDEVVVKSIKDINEAFDRDVNNEFKTIMKWEI